MRLMGRKGTDRLQADNPFQSASLDQARCVWHPAAHRYYQEYCSYFLLRLRGPAPTAMADTLTRLLVQAQISSYCVYIVYGYYDGLIRVWATPQKRARLIRLFEQNRGTVENVLEFQARDIRYLWATNVPNLDERAIQTNLATIDAVCKAILRGDAPSEDELGTLKRTGLIHHLTPVQGGIKFYLALSRLPGSVMVGFEADEIARSLEGLSDTVQNISLYSGLGFADYLIKGVVADFQDVAKSTYEIDSATSRFELRPMTLLIANQDAVESDHIDIEWEDFSTSLIRLESILGPASAEHISQLDHPARNAVGAVFEAFADLLGTPSEPIFLGLLESRLRGDVILLGEKLSFILRLEGLLRRYLVRVWSEEFGASWVRSIQRVASECNVDPKKQPAKDYTLHDLITVSGKLAAEDSPVGERLERTLGGDWTRHVFDVRGLRNHVAHGSIYEPEFGQTFFARWEDVASSVCRVARVYNRLIEIAT